ncbi:unnamed protein product [Owenia fusiformis]|uniref:Galaxin-like repeats domain-containing protein n=1 Tax=Owenia fusiformis TaxID=6347 RepID=A0A8J1TC81_OWEFU|nr:unnamed protein product [Owenia fusiformis]
MRGAAWVLFTLTFLYVVKDTQAVLPKCEYKLLNRYVTDRDQPCAFFKCVYDSRRRQYRYQVRLCKTNMGAKYRSKPTRVEINCDQYATKCTRAYQLTIKANVQSEETPRDESEVNMAAPSSSRGSYSRGFNGRTYNRNPISTSNDQPLQLDIDVVPCGSNTYDPTTQVCCEGTVSANRGGAMQCCGKRTFSPGYGTCCNGQLSYDEHECCCGDSRKTYNPAIEGCCPGAYSGYCKISQGSQCCKYSGTRQRCVSPSSGYTSLDGTCTRSFSTGCGRFNPLRHTCCDGVLVPGARQNCCGKQGYSYKEKTCCNGRLFDETKRCCCGDTTLDPKKGICCGDKVALFADFNTNGLSCCEGVAYLPPKQRCIDGKVEETVNGGWGEWKWSGKCSKSCGGGFEDGERFCDNPAPQYGGKDCIGEKTASRPCNEQGCPVDGGFSNWVYGVCSVPCGDGQQQGTRKCNDPTPVNGGKDCEGPRTTSRPCKESECPIDGAWGSLKWSGKCSVTCGKGVETGTRVCDNPAPQYGGKDCPGDGSESRECEEPDCPVDGAWGEWELVGKCDATCGPGFQTKRRYCNNPAPKHGGRKCGNKGNQMEEDERERCNLGKCTLNDIDGEGGDDLLANEWNFGIGYDQDAPVLDGDRKAPLETAQNDGHFNNYANVFGDPHIFQNVGPDQIPICYDVNGKVEQIFEFLTESYTGLQLRAQFLPGPDEDFVKYVGRIGIKIFDYTLEFNINEVILNGEEHITWSKKDKRLIELPGPIAITIRMNPVRAKIYIGDLLNVNVSRWNGHLDFNTAEDKQLENSLGGIMGDVLKSVERLDINTTSITKHNTMVSSNILKFKSLNQQATFNDEIEEDKAEIETVGEEGFKQYEDSGRLLVSGRYVPVRLQRKAPGLCWFVAWENVDNGLTELSNFTKQDLFD